MRLSRHSPTLALLAISVSATAAATAPPPLSAFLDKHCIDCHDADMKKGELDLTSLKFDLTDTNAFQRWQRVFERVRDGEMPPAKKPRPEKMDLEGFVAGLKQPLTAADVDDIATHGRVRSRRLTRTEYEHTIHDLLGIDIPLQELLPADRASHGFETVAEGQQLSHHQLARYLDAADLALSEAFDRAINRDATFKRTCTPQDLARAGRGNYRGPDLRDGKSISWPIGLQFTGRMPATEVPADGWYRITIRGVHAINPNKQGVVWGTLRSGACASNAPMLYMIGTIEATATPRDLVYEAWIQKGHILELKPNDGELRRAPTGAKGGNVSFVGRDLEKEGYSGIANRGIEMERINVGADRATVRRFLFGDEDLSAVKANRGAALSRLVAQFARRAFRRPVDDDQLAPYREIGRQALADGESLPQALRATYRAMLCSPRFLTFVEAPGDLDDHAVASRLSYALWVSMPDGQLMDLAAEGKLRQPEVLARQVERMLADPKATRFIHSFTDQWLKLKEIDFTSPDTRQFPTFDAVVQESMLQETRAYVAELIKKDLGVTHLIDSDFAFLNERLVRHYRLASEGDDQTGTQPYNEKRTGSAQATSGMPTPPVSLSHGLIVPTASGAVRRMPLPPGSHRGGLLTQGAILKVTADGTSTSPVVRGVFVNERILSQHIPPPPPGTPAIEPDIRGAISIRDQLDKHRSNTSCQSCHITIDPPGLVLENFDPVGIWRTAYGARGSGVKVDPSGATPDGEAFGDLSGWRQIYTRRADALGRGFTEQFLTYATGAAIRFSDKAAVEGIVAETADGGHGLRAMIRTAVASSVFLRK